MSSKQQKMTARRGWASKEPAHSYDHVKFVNESATERFGLISKNMSFIKEKGFHHPKDFFRRTIANKRWRALCQPLTPAAVMVVREFYANLASHMNKKVRVRGVCVNFYVKSINEFYYLESMDTGAFDSLYAAPNYLEILQVLTNGKGEWKLNSEKHTLNFQAKHLAYIPKVWHHFITSRHLLTTNVYEVTAKRALLNFAILQDIPFDVGQVIEDAILYNKDVKMNLGHQFLIFGLCKTAGVRLEDNEAWIHPIKAISVKKDKPGVPRPKSMYDSGNELSDEDELREYQARFGLPIDLEGDTSQTFSYPLPPQTSTHPPPPHPS